MYKKTISIYLADSEPSGRLYADLTNWLGKAYKIPRNLLKESQDILEFKTAVYLLFGYDDGLEKPLIYVGETEDAFTRLKEHLKEDYWDEIIVFVATDNSLNKAKVKNLENILYLKAKETNRYTIKNSKIPQEVSMLDREISELEEFFDNITLLTTTLGHKVFEPLINKIDEFSKYKYKEAYCLVTTEGYVLLKGSKLSEKIAPGMIEKINRLREKYADKIKNNVLIENILFNSPSGASDFVSGNSTPGPRVWINCKTNKTLKEMENA